LKFTARSINKIPKKKLITNTENNAPGEVGLLTIEVKKPGGAGEKCRAIAIEPNASNAKQQA
jgi:hypothetical protein